MSTAHATHDDMPRDGDDGAFDRAEWYQDHEPPGWKQWVGASVLALAVHVVWFITAARRLT